MPLQIGVNTWGTPSSNMGLNSGMDLAGMITKLMNAKDAQTRIPIQQKLQLNEWKQDAYRTMNTALTAFQSQINSLQYSTGWQARTATSTDPTKVTATATAGAPAASHTVTVNSLATAATASSSGGITTTLGLTGSVLGNSVTVDSSNNQFNLTVNGVTKTVTIANSPTGGYSAVVASGTSPLMQAVQSAIDQAFGANTVMVSESASKQLSLTPSGTGAVPQVQITNAGTSNGVSALGFTSGQAYKIDPNATLASQVSAGKFTGPTAAGAFQINGQTIQFDPNTDTLNTLINKVNASAANVTMSYDATGDKVVVTTKNTGLSAQISWSTTAGTQNDGGLLAALKINTATVTGQDASVKIDGTTLAQSSNSFTFGGVSYNLVGVGSANVTVATDTTALTKQVTDFVNNYNTIINKIATKLYEPTYRGYPALTSSQTATMTDNQIAQYNAQAQSGLLKNDDLLRQAYNNFRSVTYSSTPGTSTYHALYDIGITGQAYNASDPTNAGKLVIDTNKFQAALAANPSDVTAIMNDVTQKLNGFAQNTVNSTLKRAGFNGNAYDDRTTNLGSQALDLENRISNADTRLKAEFKYYILQFTAMDTAIGKSNQQMSWLQNLKF
jgi:flagellar hook-associated protein 2